MTSRSTKATLAANTVWLDIERRILYSFWLAIPLLLLIRLYNTGGNPSDPVVWMLGTAFALTAIESRRLSIQKVHGPAGTGLILMGYASIGASAWVTNPAAAAMWPVLTFLAFIRLKPWQASALAGASLAVFVLIMTARESVTSFQIYRTITIGSVIIIIFQIFFSLMRQTLEDLHSTRTTLNNSIRSLVYGVMLVDADGKITVSNQRVSELLDLPDDLIKAGVPEADLLTFLRRRGELTAQSVETIQLYDRQWRSIPSETDDDGAKESLLARLGQGEVFGYYIRKNNKGRYLKVTVAPADDGGHIRTYEDVTDSVLVNRQMLSVIQDMHQLRRKDHARSREQVIEALSKLAKYRDEETGEHIVRTQLYIRALADGLRAMNAYSDQLNESFVETTVKAAPMHDLGKIGIPDAILKKPGRLTDDEMQIMRTHALIGEATLNAMRDSNEDPQSVVSVAARIAGGHHENWDGSGYPRHLQAHQIPLEARLMALADNYDALTTTRVYKKSWTHEEASEEIKKLSGAKFDPLLVDAFLLQEDQFRAIALRFKDTAAAPESETMPTPA